MRRKWGRVSILACVLLTGSLLAAEPEIPGPLWMSQGLGAYLDFAHDLETFAVNPAGLTVVRKYRAEPGDTSVERVAHGWMGPAHASRVRRRWSCAAPPCRRTSRARSRSGGDIRAR